MKERIPWPLKVGAKLTFSLFHVNYRALKKLGLVEHGRMEDAAFARSVYARHVDGPLSGELARGCLLELGPGDSLATGFLGRAAGFDQVVLIDSGEFADLASERIDCLCKALGTAPPAFAPAPDAAAVRAALEHAGIRYLTAGMQSLSTLPTASVQHSFSNTVLQHVSRDEVEELTRQLGRVHAPGSRSSHLIKFNDHFSGGYLNLKIPNAVMESALVRRANLYTNRVGAGRFAELFSNAGFRLEKVSVDFEETAIPAQDFTDAEALSRAAAGRQVLRALFLLRKN